MISFAGASRFEVAKTARAAPSRASTLRCASARRRPDATDQLSLTFAALADPTRRAILARLAEGEATVNEVAARFPISVPAISRHLKVLEQAGLITRTRSAQLRPSRLEGAPLKDAVDWLEKYRPFWAGGFDRLEGRLKESERSD